MASERTRFEILVAEDNPADVRLVEEALKHHAVNCALHVVSDGEQAISFIDRLESDPKRFPLDLLLVDMHLPKYDGEEILRHLRSTERYAQTPVVVMTGADSIVVEEKAVKHAALSYFRKRPKLDEFLELGSIIRRILIREAQSDDDRGRS